ncbi:hypothetical protein Tco_0708615 [Tanacetum coccineum]
MHVRLALEESEPGVTVMNLTQTDVPEEDRYGNSTVVDNTERGRRDLIFHKIRAVFGFAIIYIDIILSTLGAALQSLTGAPRLLATIANDDILPVLNYFKVGMFT